MIKDIYNLYQNYMHRQTFENFGALQCDANCV